MTDKKSHDYIDIEFICAKVFSITQKIRSRTQQNIEPLEFQRPNISSFLLEELQSPQDNQLENTNLRSSQQRLVLRSKLLSYISSSILKDGIRRPCTYHTVNFDYYKDKNLVEKYNLKNAAGIADRVLCLPIYPDLGIADVDRIVETIKKML